MQSDRASPILMSPPPASPQTRPSRAADPGVNQRVAYDLRSLDRKQNELQQHIQALLDAQADNLLIRVDHEPDAASTTGTDMAASISMSKVIPIRQPRQIPIGLWAARKGIRKAMRELASYKAQELEILDEELEHVQQKTMRIEDWRTKRQGLQSKIDGIQQSDRGSRARELDRENVSLQEQISKMEVTIAELRSQQRAVRSQRAQIDNTMQSDLSSFNAALSQLDREVQAFLKPSKQSLPQGIGPAISSSFLPSKIANLDMAVEHFKSMQETQQRYQEEADVEHEALEEGIVVWTDAMHEIRDLEAHLRGETNKTSAEKTTTRLDDDAQENGMSNVIHHLDQTFNELESKYNLAEARGWSLLVCCLGAELEALRKGGEILQQASEVSYLSSPRSEAQSTLAEVLPIQSFNADNDDLQTPHSSADRLVHAGDEGPDEDLLISRHDTDTE